MLRIQKLEGRQCKSRWGGSFWAMAHFEPPQQDLRCLQIQLFLSPVLKELKTFLEITNMKLVRNNTKLTKCDT